MTSATHNRRPNTSQHIADVVANGGTITAQLRACMPTLTPSGQRIGQAILAEPRDIIHMTVTDLAERTETSVATIVRFCQDISLKGFADPAGLFRLRG
ncbi:Helix-turn-helix domain-containing protein, rpiR family [Parafrankia irregularis]|uniref:Helix-turn-helix domain-containing protein, rpiR family n=2 Tax=Parafrankia TaxID=2994362 RepID=A0A0S4QVL4_9ACTN|nr:MULTISPECIES: MurR/RpiR family transcriptional regulator [Frankiaceae]MBE3204780.1 MurR/RpiR family transcriptional regulator [Parafrankia sp. CH37]CUU59739.1 Helix-turn-helix domain-containing protein, rpiR family [Parafrankia irregularis]